jgi:nicotinate phosphoribosyltransferase
MRAILEEVRWELDAAGYEAVQIVLSGGVTRNDIVSYRDIVDAFGVGGAIANAPVVDFALDIVSIEGLSCAKRGKKSGTKQVWEIQNGRHVLLPSGHAGPEGGTPLISRYIREGAILKRPPLSGARDRLIRSLSQMEGILG